MSTDNDTTSYSIYRIVCLATFTFYVGKAKDPDERKRAHFSQLKNNKHFNHKMQKDYNLHSDTFYFEVLERGISEYDINQVEVEYICKGRATHTLYNVSKGGNGARQHAHTKEVMYNGILYKSLKAAALANGIKSSAMSTRVSLGYGNDEAMIGKGNSPVNRKSCTFDGVTYTSLTQAAKTLGVTDEAVNYYIKRGYVSETDIGKGGGFGAQPVTWNDIEYPSLNAAAHALDISNSALSERLKKGYQCDTDMKRRFTWKSGAKGKPCKWNGELFASVSAAARSRGVDVSTMYEQLTKGYTCDADLRPRTKH